MVKSPKVDEQEFLKLTKNYGELCNKLGLLGYEEVKSELEENGQYIGLCWLRLGKEHLTDARSALGAGSRRSAYSRSYYAAYNSSKAVRYIVQGAVGFAADDHRKASELPDDFPDVDTWSENMTKLREMRLAADYDNWNTTKFVMAAANAVSMAEQFVANVEEYLKSRYGIVP